MSSEVTYSTVAELRAANAALQTELQKLRSDLMTAIAQQQRQNVARVSGIELRSIKWGAQILAMSIAFTLLVAFLAKHEFSTREEIATAVPRATN